MGKSVSGSRGVVLMHVLVTIILITTLAAALMRRMMDEVVESHRVRTQTEDQALALAAWAKVQAQWWGQPVSNGESTIVLDGKTVTVTVSGADTDKTITIVTP